MRILGDATLIGAGAVFESDADFGGTVTLATSSLLANDLDPNETVVHLKEGNPREFSILLNDGRGGNGTFILGKTAAVTASSGDISRSNAARNPAISRSMRVSSTKDRSRLVSRSSSRS